MLLINNAKDACVGYCFQIDCVSFDLPRLPLPERVKCLCVDFFLCFGLLWSFFSSVVALSSVS